MMLIIHILELIWLAFDIGNTLGLIKGFEKNRYVAYCTESKRNKNIFFESAKLIGII